MSPVPLDRRFRARLVLTTRLPVVCWDAFKALLGQTEKVFKGQGPMYDSEELEDALTERVTAWARGHRLEADWLIDRVGALVWVVQVARAPAFSRKPSLADCNPHVWKYVESVDRDVTAHGTQRATVKYRRITAGENELAPPDEPFKPSDQITPGVLQFQDRERLRRRAFPVLAWPDVESREEFQKRALQHYETRAAAAKSAGLTQYRKAPALQRHVVWLLQKRVLGMSLNSIADLAQQERDTRRGGTLAVIEARSVSREIKKLERLLPL